MKTYTIPAGRHDDGTLNCPWLLKVPTLRRRVRFTDSCRYQLPAYNQLDVNKLFGSSFGLTEDNSARFGWRYRPDSDQIELLAYVHENGQLNRNELFDFPVVAAVAIGETVACTIRVESSVYVFQVDNHPPVAVPHGKLQTRYGLNRGLWFGGGCTAPQDITVEMETF